MRRATLGPCKTVKLRCPDAGDPVILIYNKSRTLVAKMDQTGAWQLKGGFFQASATSIMGSKEL